MKLRIVLVAALATAVSLAFGDQLDVSQFAKTFTVVVPASSVPNGAVADFPALVRLSTAIDGFSYSDFRQQDGGDLAFTDMAGEVIPHEIDTWNESGESLVWVKVPTLARGTVIRCYYGNSSYSSAVAATSVWSGFVGVWHMKEATGAIADSSGHSLSATRVGNDPSLIIQTPGYVGNAVYQSDDEGNSTYLEVPSYDNLSVGGSFAISGWFNADSITYARLFSRGTSAVAGFEAECGGDGSIYARGSTAASRFVNTDATPLVGNWTHVAVVYDDASVSIYVNGVLKKTGTTDAVVDNGNPLCIGCSGVAGEKWSLKGKIDEFRLLADVPSDAWIAAEYDTAHNKDFLAYGSVISNGIVNPADYTRFVQLTIGSSALSEDTLLFDVPVLVRLSTSLTGFDYGDFRLARGGDLVFADAAGHVIAHEIDTWNTDGESLVWVKVPLLTSGTAIYAYWGSATASPLASTATWSAYKGVWHMNESGSTAEPDVSGNNLDAVPTSNSLTTWGGEPADTTPSMVALTEGGVAGSYRRNQTDYAGYIHNYLSIPSYTLGDTFTFSGWFNMKHQYAWHRIVSRKLNAGDNGGWHVEWNAGENDSVNVLGAGGGCVTAKTGQFFDEWISLTFAFSGTTVSVYTNGALSASGTVGAVSDNGEILAVGNNIVGTEASFEGYYDEIRLGAGALSAERIAADYAIVHDTSFVSFGAVGVPAANAPVMATPVFSKNALGEIEISVSMLSGTGTTYVRFTTADGNTDVALSEGIVTGPQSYTVAIPSNLAADKTYSFAAVGVNTAGGETVAEGSGVFYNGTLSVAKTSDADEDGPVAGVFTVSRADSYGDLPVKYSLSGTAVAGTDYVGSASGTVVIPNGSTSATVSIVPKVNSAVNVDTTVVFAFAGGFYSESVSTATMTIANLAPVTRREFLKRIDFSFPMEFLADGETLTNFPALVKLSTAISGFSYSDLQLANGGDMMFTDSRGQVIPSEVDTWDDTGTSLVWVTIPELTKGTVVTMYYGNGANPAGIPIAKWPDYAGVWHMGEASGTAHDSTANGLDAEPVHNNPWNGDQTAIADGAIGKGRINQMESTRYSVDYATYSSDPDVRARSKRSFARVADYSSLEVGSRFTFSGWFRTIHGAEWTEYMACRSMEGNYWGWHIQRLSTHNEMDARVSVRVADGGGDFTIPNMKGNWVHLVFSFDKIQNENNVSVGEVKVYGNGESAPLYSGSGRGSTFIHDVALPLTFGNLNDVADGLGFNGQYDELRLKRGASSANWAKAEYLTVTDASFVSASGALPAVPGLMIFVR